MNEKVKERLINELTIEELKEMANDLNSCCGRLDDLYWYDNDEEFFNMFFDGKLDELVRAICYGEYNYMDDYVHFNAYGNLDSCCEYEYERQIEDSAEDIIEAYIDEIDNMWDNDLKKKIKNIMDEEEENENGSY